MNFDGVRRKGSSGLYGYIAFNVKISMRGLRPRERDETNICGGLDGGRTTPRH
jgi:hypothetical protein